ncbi:hypothetical protein DVH24_003171 [Malus domestica]|uniref:Terpene synthase N-terminal domain-containing protein n=1 Tax=Malus domestica TaxID=3750 RepID=A0A498KC37_MALDO|nr:hypothetical protein DVH24_003171 [Malus domestica]
MINQLHFNPLEKLELIDVIQRLGISHHFENEIDEVLLQIHNNSYNCYRQRSDDDDDLHATAIYFRLLRQQDMFNKFKDVDDAKFKESLTNDVVGLLSLYQATHLRVHGEDILEEALSSTTTHLESAAHRLSPVPLPKQVMHALYQPLWKGNPRLEARHYFSIYHEHRSYIEIQFNKNVCIFSSCIGITSESSYRETEPGKEHIEQLQNSYKEETKR